MRPLRKDPTFLAAAFVAVTVVASGYYWRSETANDWPGFVVSLLGWLLLGQLLWIRRQGGNVHNTLRARLRDRHNDRW